MTEARERLVQGVTAEETERRTRLFHTIFVVQVVGLAVFDVLGSLEQPTLAGLIWVNGPVLSLIALMVAARAMVRRGAYLGGVIVTLAAVLVGLAFFIAFYGARSPIPAICVWPILTSAILIDPRAGVATASVCASMLLGVLALEVYQVVPLPLFADDESYVPAWHGAEDPAVVAGTFLDAATTIVVFYLTSFLAWISSRGLADARVRSDEVIDELEAVAAHNTKVASKITVASARLGEWLRDQQQGAWSQSVAVQKIAESVKTLLEASSQIDVRTATVMERADKSLENDERIVSSIQALLAHSERIGEILQVMKDIANKSDVLALNAALEGVKAGERGEGFVLVAARIQVLAEDVLASLASIRSIIDDIHAASTAAISSTREGTETTRQTAELTKQIREITGRQKTGTEQVSRAIAEIETVAQQTVVASTEVLQAMAGLVELSNEIRGASTGQPGREAAHGDWQIVDQRKPVESDEPPEEPPI